MANAPDLFPGPCVYVDDFARGFTRKKRGDAFVYTTHKGAKVRAEKTIARLNAVGLPPAYEDAWYCNNPRGHIQALGTDAKGRRQYRYHPGFRSEAEDAKFAALPAFAKALPGIRAHAERALARRDLSRERVVAAVVRLLDIGHVRVGNKQYARDNKSFGATTLKTRHAKVGRDTLRLDFMGKSGKRHQIAIGDRRLASLARQCSDLPGQPLFQYLDAEGVPRPVDSSDINAWLKETGADFTAKTFRTWHASVIAYTALANRGGAAKLKEVLGEVSAKLGNTPAVARKSYVHPALIDVMTGAREWDPAWNIRRRATRWLTRDERGFVAVLDALAAEATAATADTDDTPASPASASA